MKMEYIYAYEKFHNAVLCLTCQGDQRERLYKALQYLKNIEIQMHPEKHLPEVIRDDYLEFITRMSSIKAVRDEGDFRATINSLDEEELNQAASDIISFFDCVCRYEGP